MEIIKRVITALGDYKINEQLKEEKIEVVCGDILYKEGILEFLENDNNIDFLVVNDELSGDITTEELIEKIENINKKIKIILISNKENNDIKVYKKINEINKDKIINIILKKDSVYNKPYIPVNDFLYNNSKNAETITILGANGIGKSVFSIILANIIERKKILIFNFDILNNSILNLLGVKQNIKEQNNFFINNFEIKDFIIKTNSNIDLITGSDLIFNLKLSPNDLIKIIKNLKKEYDLIILDTASDNLLDYIKELADISDYLIFISDANLLEIKKAQQLLSIYVNDWNINKEKIKIIFNKCTNKSIDDGVLRELFRNYEIIGRIKLSDYYDLAVNKNNARNEVIQKDIKYIRRKIIKRKNNF